MGKKKKAKLPKSTCCVSSVRCKRCPIRMLQEGTLPEGYTVRKRKLVKLGKAQKKALKKSKKLATAA